MEAKIRIAGAPGRAASDSRTVTGASAALASQQARQWRTVFGQTPRWRAISRTPVPAAERRIIPARSASLRGVLCARASRCRSSAWAGVRMIGAAVRRGMKVPANQGEA
jgi:hypothetical protein